MASNAGKRWMHRSSAWGWFPTWRQAALPGVGDAPQFAFTTYALAPSSFIPRSFAVPQPPGPHTPQIEHKQQQRIDGYGLVAGQIMAPSLINPYLMPMATDDFNTRQA